MSFQATDFLTDLYAPDGPEVATLPEGPADPEAATSAEAPAFDFEGWDLRPDVSGRLGLEAPDLPDFRAWWRWTDFDDLPGRDWECPECGGLLWWEDLLGGQHCRRCEAEAAERADRLAARVAELVAAGGPCRGTGSTCLTCK